MGMQHNTRISDPAIDVHVGTGADTVVARYQSIPIKSLINLKVLKDLHKSKSKFNSPTRRGVNVSPVKQIDCDNVCGEHRAGV